MRFVRYRARGGKKLLTSRIGCATFHNTIFETLLSKPDFSKPGTIFEIRLFGVRLFETLLFEARFFETRLLGPRIFETSLFEINISSCVKFLFLNNVGGVGCENRVLIEL